MLKSFLACAYKMTHYTSTGFSSAITNFTLIMRRAPGDGIGRMCTFRTDFLRSPCFRFASLIAN